MRVTRLCASVTEAVADIPDGASLMVGGFVIGTPWNLLTALYDQGATGLTVISNHAGLATYGAVKGFAELIDSGRVRKLIASFTASPHPSRTGASEALARAGKLELELVPQGTLAERIRAGGAGIPAFFTPAAVGTLLGEGRPSQEFDGRTYLMERALVADYAFIRAWKADTAGNLIFRLASRNYNPIMAMAARCTIVEVEEPIVPAGTFRPDEIHTPGLYVDRMVQIPPDGIRALRRPKMVERLKGPQGGLPLSVDGPAPKERLDRDQMAAVVARFLEPGWIANLGVGIPTLACNYLDPSSGVLLTSENGVLGYGMAAGDGLEDLDVVNASGEYVVLEEGAAIVHHADSFALIRSGRLDCAVLGAYEVAPDGSFANWKWGVDEPANMGGIGGAMDLAACAKQVFIAMAHTTRDGQPRLVERCSLPLTALRGVTLVVTDLAVVAVRDGIFELLEHAPGWTVEEIRAVTGAPLHVSPTLRPIPLCTEQPWIQSAATIGEPRGRTRSPARRSGRGDGVRAQGRNCDGVSTHYRGRGELAHSFRGYGAQTRVVRPFLLPCRRVPHQGDPATRRGRCTQGGRRMFFVSILTSDRARDPELWAVIWQGKAPPTLKLHAVYNLAGNKRVYVWEGDSPDDLQFMDRFNHVGVLETYPAFERTEGWQHAFAGDLDAFRRMLEAAGTSPKRIEAAMDLRSRGHHARTTEMAMHEAREWSRRQAEGG